MQTNIEKQEHCKTIITLKSNSEDWKSKIEKAYTKLESKVSVNGFRKGKAPKEILRSKVNLEDVFNEALNTFLSENYTKVLTENKLNPIIQPTVDIKKISLEEVECTITVIEEPTVELKDYKGLTIEKETVEVNDTEIENEIKKLQEKSAEVVVKETGNANKGDIVTIDFEGFVDGVAFDGGKASDYDLELGSNTFIPGFEDQLVGASIGESKDVNVKFPENYVENLKGKDATFKVTVKGIKTKVYPEINDDLALDANLDDVENLEQLKDYYKKELTTKKENEALNNAYTKLIDTILDNTNIDIAKEIIDDEVHHSLEARKNEASQYGLEFNQYLSMMGIKEDEFMAKLEETSTKNLKYIFTLLAIAKEEKIQITTEDYQKAYEDMSKQYNMPVDDVKKALASREAALGHDLLLQKVSEFLKKENNI